MFERSSSSLGNFFDISLNQESFGQREIHITLGEALEEAKLKRIGERRDQTNVGGLTYKAC